MNIIKPKVEIIPEQNMLKRIEIAGRTAYKSEDRINDGSAKKFFDSLVKRGHESVLEHSNIIIYTQNNISDVHFQDILREYEFDTNLPHFIRNSQSANKVYIDGGEFEFSNIYSGNLRAWRSLVKRYYAEPIFIRLFFHHFAFKDIYENISNDLKRSSRAPLTEFDFAESVYDDSAQAEILDWAPGDIHNIITARFTCSRAIANEIVRSRTLSFTQTSTRYIRVGELDVIEPWWYEDIGIKNYDVMKTIFLKSGLEAEENYKNYSSNGASPQLARDCLPQSTAAEIVITGTVKDWARYLDLRTAAGAHPDIIRVSQIMQALFEEMSAQTINWSRKAHG